MITILDTTYREGKQSSLAHILPDSITDYARIAEKVGIEYLQVAYPFMSDTYLAEVRKLVASKPRIHISSHSPIHQQNIENIVREGITAIDVSLKVDESDLEKNVAALTEISSSCLEKHQVSPTFRIGLEYALKMPIDMVQSMSERLSAIPAVTRISISDTDGIALPHKLGTLLQRLDDRLPKQIALEVHLHNDSGLAAANMLETILIFKNHPRELVIDATLGGIGERNGIVSIADVLSVLYLDKQSPAPHYDRSAYRELYEFVFHGTSFNRDPKSPQAFSHTSGIHIQKYLESGMYEYIDPAIFGQKTTFVFNESISSGAIRSIAKHKLQRELDTDAASQIARHIRNVCATNKIAMDEDTVLATIKEMAGQ